MTYLEQLQHERWFEKRKLILNRDAYKCIIYQNLSYISNFFSGIISSNKISPLFSNTKVINGVIVAKIFDISRKILLDIFINDGQYSPNENYVVYYYENPKKHPVCIALKILPESELEIKTNLLDVTKFGIRAFFTEKTIANIAKPISQNDKWSLVKGLHIHHTYYQEEKFAWEYENESLQTLCWFCHEKLHQDQSIPRLNKDGVNIGKLRNCKRCYGAGYFPQFKHVDSGVCFHCRGKRFEELI